MKEIICQLFGCKIDDCGYGCVRCGRVLYDELPGYFWKPLQLIRGVRDNIMGWIFSHVKTYKKCAECNNSFWGYGYEDCCSDACWRNHVPF
jgi:hypothetical protein